MTICVFGDSTAWGAWDLEKGGWVNRLWLYFANGDYDVNVYNASISGGTTATLLERFEVEARARFWRYGDMTEAAKSSDVVLFQLGGNDASYLNTPGNYMVQPDDFKQNLKKLLELSRKFTHKAIFMGFKNIDESKTMPVPWHDGLYYTNKDILMYDEMIKTFCNENKVSHIDIFGLLSAGDWEDGVHPNAKGHEKIFEEVKIFLLENKFA